MTLKHLAWDIETLDTKPSAAVVSIGAIWYDPNTDELGDTYYAVLAIQPQYDAGRTYSASTLEWWAQQSEAAQSVLSAPATPVELVLKQLGDFMFCAQGVWGNGADFDNVIIGDLYRSFSQKAPWSFGKNRCFRTIKSLPLPRTFVAPVREGTHHNALDDAIYQARYHQAVAKALALVF